MTPEQQPAVLWSVKGGIGRITMNRPDHANAIDRRCAADLAIACDSVANAPDLRVVVLTGNGPMFCGGGDIAEFVEHRETLPQLVDEILLPILAPWERLMKRPVPVVTVVNGPFGGAGIALALCGDVVLAADHVKMRGGYAAIGLSPDMGASWFLAQRAGAARAKQVFLLNRAIDAQQCLQWGLVDELHPREKLHEAAEKVIAQLAAGAAASQARVKTLCGQAATTSLGDHLRDERESLVACAGTADAREGVRAFMEKRPARFGG